ncbi:ABC transporter permease [Consotaella salsifontis]|uniref:Glutathione transport system permease protein GsiC n=1 Tax=Consotaella salsifontis TaxID=1365950 RepID=A0A1T4SP78_9HYPH|nr:ABC transporter permease [Consotaella salsifontis]SKA29992.1 glutathione transport system permease protein [Consotaella salsifontis]
MKTYIARKLLALPLIVLGVSLLVFLAIRMLPGDPARMMAGPEAPEAAVEAMRVRLGLGQPLFMQYFGFVVHAIQGDFGISIRSNLPVASEIANRFPYTFALALTSYAMAILIGVPAGMAAAVFRNRWPDQIVMLLAIAGASVANFWLALMAMNYFAVELHWLPLLGAGSWKHYILPTIALGTLPTALIARMTRSSMIEVLSQDFIRTARAKGLGSFAIYRKHALRNALIPIVTIVGLNFGSIMGGAVVTESVFNWPGIGRLLVDSVRYRDYPMIEGVTLLAVVSVVVVNFLAEMAIAAINPRIRLT